MIHYSWWKKIKGNISCGKFAVGFGECFMRSLSLCYFIKFINLQAVQVCANKSKSTRENQAKRTVEQAMVDAFITVGRLKMDCTNTYLFSELAIRSCTNKHTFFDVCPHQTS